MSCLNNLDTNINYTYEKAKFSTDNNGLSYQSLNFLDVQVILKADKTIETDIYYKTTNSHDYLPYDSAHPLHCKNNIPYNLAKRIIVFVTDEAKTKHRLRELRLWLQECKYPDHIISKAFHDAKLQGPAPAPKNPRNNIPFVTTYNSNTNHKFTLNNMKRKLETTNDIELANIFKDCNIILSQRQPPNLLRLLNNKNKSDNTTGVFKCKDKRCKICALYLMEGNEFKLSNNKTWYIRSMITCHSVNVIYFLTCNMCNNETYIGKTIGDTKHGRGFKVRMNQHISESRTGESSCKFPNHVYNCGIKNNCLIEPFFKINVMISLNEPDKLETMESSFQISGYDTLNNR